MDCLVSIHCTSPPFIERGKRQLSISATGVPQGAPAFVFWGYAPRGFLVLLYFFFEIFTFSFEAGAGFLLLSSLPSLKFFIYSFDALRPRRAPTFWPAESRQRLAKEGCAPFGIPPAVALECLRHNRARGVTELLAASRQELPGDLRGRCCKSRFGRGTMRWRA